MVSTLGGRDPRHDFSDEEKDKLEKDLRSKGRKALQEGQPKIRVKLEAQAREISRRKSKKAHQDGD